MIKPESTDRALNFLAGGGEMGARIRALDGQAIGLGPQIEWPAPLRTGLRILLSTNHPVFLFWGCDSRCFYNDAYSRSLGPEKHPSILGARGVDAWQEIWDIIGPQIDFVMQGRGATWHENQLVPIIRHGVRDDVYWTYSYSPIDDPAGAHGVGGVLVMVTETTEQVRSAERLRNAEARWRSLFEQAPGFACITSGPQHVFEFANPSYFQLIGQTHILGRTVADVLPWAVDQGFVARLDAVYAHGQAFSARSAPIVMSDPDGHGSSERYLDFVYQPIRDSGGVVSGVFVLGSDVTERVKAESALRDSEARLRLACEAAELGIFDHDLIHDSIQWDSRTRSFWGVGSDEPVSYAVFERGLHRDDIAEMKARFERAMDPAGSGAYMAEYRVIHRVDGQVRWVAATGQVRFAHGRATRLVGTVQDITERRDADARRNEFLATLGHELRNPLAPIANALQILKMRRGGDESSNQALTVIDRQLQHIVRLIEDLLDVVRITRGRVDLRRERVALSQVIDAALETSSPQIHRGRHRIETHLPADPVWVQADAIRLAQVFANLIINACKYSDTGSVVRVTVELRPDSRVAVAVRDHGIGIPAPYLTRVFEIFSQAQPAIERSQGGLGIGLSLAKGLVELHGGSIEARSEGLGKGSEFTVVLPRAAQDNEMTIETFKPSAREPVAGLRVLVVDDNHDAADTLSTLLELCGATTKLAGSGRQALELADEMHPHAVLLDLGLPDMTGFEVCLALRGRPWAQSLRIVAITGWGQASDRASTRAAGFDTHLVKPVDLDELLASLEGLG